MKMNIQQVSDAELSEFIAPLLGWKQTQPKGRWHSPDCQADRSHCNGKLPDVVNDPAMTVMVLKFLLVSRDYECLIGPDEIEMAWRPSAVKPGQSFMVSLIKNELGRAIAEVFALASGWTESVGRESR